MVADRAQVDHSAHVHAHARPDRASIRSATATATGMVTTSTSAVANACRPARAKVLFQEPVNSLGSASVTNR